MARPRGRPRSFDEEEVLERALEAFWKRGFEGTSLDDLTEATGVARPSLFAAFGNKEAIYVRAITLYGERMRVMFDDAFKDPTPIEKSFKRFFSASIEMYCGGKPGPRGCFGLCTAPAVTVEHPAIRLALAEALRATDERFEAELRRAVSDGELSQSADTRRLAKKTSATLHSIAIRARAGASRSELEELAEQAVEELVREGGAKTSAPAHDHPLRRGRRSPKPVAQE